MFDFECFNTHCDIMRSLHGCYVSSSSGNLQLLIWNPRRTKMIKISCFTWFFFLCWWRKADYTVSSKSCHHHHLGYLRHSGSSICCLPEAFRSPSTLPTACLDQLELRVLLPFINKFRLHVHLHLPFHVFAWFPFLDNDPSALDDASNWNGS